MPAIRKRPLLKVFLDNVIWRPFLILYSFVAFGILMGRTPKEIAEELRQKFRSSYLTGLKIHPISSLINMTVVPLPMRTSWSELVGFFWNWYLSIKMSNPEDEEGAEEEAAEAEEEEQDFKEAWDESKKE